jgi:hypothetical protein
MNPVTASPLRRVVAPSHGAAVRHLRRTAAAGEPRPVDAFSPAPARAPVAGVGSSASASTAAPASSAPIEAWVKGAFQDVLRRPPTSVELARFVKAIHDGVARGEHIFGVAASAVRLLKSSAEFKALHPLGAWFDRQYQVHVGREPSMDELRKGEAFLQSLAQQGQGFFETLQVATYCLKLGEESRAYRAARPFAEWTQNAFYDHLGRAATPAELAGSEQIFSAAPNVFAGGAFIQALLRQSPEFQRVHPFGAWLDGLYQQELGRPASVEELSRGGELMAKLVSEGKHVWEAGVAMQFCLRLTPEWQSRHAARAVTDRGAIYLEQPNGWTCAPTSLAMAQAAWGVQPRSVDNVWRLSQAMGVSPSTGLPGNASLIVAQARADGLQASFDARASAQAVREALLAGKTCVVNGSLGTGGHFLYVAGLDEAGRFIICDPIRPGLTRLDDAGLHAFMNAAPGQHPTGFAAVWR